MTIVSSNQKTLTIIVWYLIHRVLQKPSPASKDEEIGPATIVSPDNLHQAPPPAIANITKDIYGNHETQIARPRKELRSGRAYISIPKDLPQLRSILKTNIREHGMPELVLSEPHPVEHIRASDTEKSHNLSD